MSDTPYFLYIVRCRDRSFYTGWTTNVAQRVRHHNTGRGAKYTRSRLPVELVYCEECSSKTEALRREYAIKKLSRSQKTALVKRAGGKV